MSTIEPATQAPLSVTTASPRGRELNTGAARTIRMSHGWRISHQKQVRPISLGTRADPADGRITDLLETCRKVLGHRHNGLSKRRERSVDQPVGSDGAVLEDLELLLFGLWVLIDGKPGLASAPGKRVDEVVVFRSVAAAASILMNREAWKMRSDQTQLKRHPWSKQGRITLLEMRIAWQVLFDENFGETVFKSRMVTAARYLDGYLKQLALQRVTVPADMPKGRKLRSPQLQCVLAAIQLPAKRQ